MDDLDGGLMALAQARRLQRTLQKSTIRPARPITIGRYAKSKRRRQIKLSPDMRERHMQVMGVPGKGKSKFLEGMIREDILAGHGLMLFDPTGNLYNDLVSWLVEKGLLSQDRFILIDPNQVDYALGYNPLQFESEPGETLTQRKHKIKDVVDLVLEAFASMMGGEDAEKMPLYTRIMNMILYVIADQGLTINEAQYLIRRQSALRGFLTANSSHEIVRDAWEELGDLSARDFQNWFMASTNRIERFLMSPTIQYMLAQKENTIDFTDIMDSGKVVLVNLAATAPGYTTQDATILGRLLLNDLTRKTRLRQRIDGKNPRSFYCYIDECDRFLNEDVVQGIEKLRQFGLRMILSHQSLSQLRYISERVYGAVDGSAQVKVYFGLSRIDAEEVTKAAFSGHIDYEKVKDAFNSPSVIGFNREEFTDRTDGESFGGGQTKSDGYSSGLTSGNSSSTTSVEDSDHNSSTAGTSSSDSSGENHSESDMSSWSRSHSETRRIGLVPELSWLPSKEYSMNEQYNQFADDLFSLEPQHAYLVIPNQLSVEFVAKTVEKAACNHNRMEQAKRDYLERPGSPYRTKEEIAVELEERRAWLDSLMAQNKPLLVSENIDTAAIEDEDTSQEWQ